MPEPLKVKIIRDNQEIGSYHFEDLVRLLADGTLKPTDQYWHSGMPKESTLEQFRQLAAELKSAEKEAAIAAYQASYDREILKKKERSDTVAAWGCGLILVILLGFFLMHILAGLSTLWSSNRPITIGAFSRLLTGGFVAYYAFRLKDTYDAELKSGTTRRDALKLVFSVIALAAAGLILALLLMYLFRRESYESFWSGWASI
jgi:fatty acid desaturase